MKKEVFSMLGVFAASAVVAVLTACTTGASATKPVAGKTPVPWFAGVQGMAD